jgi:N-acetylglutamate synthase-like GNAT family acetyltransferase
MKIRGQRMDMVIRRAKAEDLAKLISFLGQAKVETNGVKETIDCFLLIENELEEIMATIGIEPLGQAGLIRSLVMTSQATEQDFHLLFEQIIMLAKEKGIKDLFLATNKVGAVKLIEQMGFQMVDKERLPELLFQSEHVLHILTVDNSIFLKLSV